MEKHTLTYYKWADVKQLLCKELNVTEEEFETKNKSNPDYPSSYQEIFESVFTDEDECYLGNLYLTCLPLCFETAEEYIEELEIENEPNVVALIKASFKIFKEIILNT